MLNLNLSIKEVITFCVFLKNNMDLLDVWKCHICKEANHLFLVIPKDVSHTPNCFNYSSKRLGLFFLKENYINIDSLTIYGY